MTACHANCVNLNGGGAMQGQRICGQLTGADGAFRLRLEGWSTFYASIKSFSEDWSLCIL